MPTRTVIRSGNFVLNRMYQPMVITAEAERSLAIWRTISTSTVPRRRTLDEPDAKGRTTRHVAAI
jgi:hypothetical protein